MDRGQRDPACSQCFRARLSTHEGLIDTAKTLSFRLIL